MGLDLKQIVANSSTINYIERGSGSPLIFVHGSVGSLEDFLPQIEYFSCSFRAIAYSRRYHPPNEPPRKTDAYALHQHTADLLALVCALGAGPAHLVGASYGAYVCLFLALQSARSVRSLTLAEPPILPILRDTPAYRHLHDAFHRNSMQPSLAAFERGDPEDGIRRFLDGILGKKGAYDLLSPETRLALQRFGPELSAEFRTDFDLYMPSLPSARLPSLKMPVLLLNGNRSPAMFHAITDELKRSIPHSQRQTIQRAGHAINLANPSLYNSILHNFLDKG